MSDIGNVGEVEQGECVTTFNNCEPTIDKDKAEEDMSNVNVFVNFEGNVGSGKSALMRKVSSKLSIIFKVHSHEENITAWMCKGQGDSLLKMYYENPKEYAARFQYNAMSDRLMNTKNYNTSTEVWKGVHVVLNKRSRSSDRVFARAHMELGNMSRLDMDIYEKMFVSLQMLLPEKADVTYVLQTPIETCMKNIAVKSRNGEERITAEYLRLLESLHNRYDWTYGGERCAICISYSEERLDQLGSKIAGDVVYLVLSKLNRMNECKRICEKDASLMQLCRVYMNHLQTQSRGGMLASGGSILTEVDCKLMSVDGKVW
ncbi:MAG: deoxynucleoside kinase [Methylococcales bacterium]|nr:deoxynucleoside kinase [Methylococcales bacterium]